MYLDLLIEYMKALINGDDDKTAAIERKLHAMKQRKEQTA
jgi:hypothetical protein